MTSSIYYPRKIRFIFQLLSVPNLAILFLASSANIKGYRRLPAIKPNLSIILCRGRHRAENYL